MKPTAIWSILRWLITAASVLWGLLATNYVFFCIMATAAPPTNKYPEAWAFEAYSWMGYAVALFCLSIAVALNLRQGFPYWRSKWNILLIVVALIALIWPRANHAVAVDKCLDSGGRWHETYQRCE